MSDTMQVNIRVPVTLTVPIQETSEEKKKNGEGVLGRSVSLPWLDGGVGLPLKHLPELEAGFLGS